MSEPMSDERLTWFEEMAEWGMDFPAEAMGELVAEVRRLREVVQRVRDVETTPVDDRMQAYEVDQAEGWNDAIQAVNRALEGNE